MSPYRYPACSYVASAVTTLGNAGQLPSTDNIPAQKKKQHHHRVLLTQNRTAETYQECSLAEVTKSALMLELEMKLVVFH